MFIILLLLQVNTIIGQTIDIIPINNEHGYTLLQLDQRLMVDSYTKILHMINLDDYIEVIDTIEANIKTLNLEQTEDQTSIDREIFLARQNIKNLLPKTQTRKTRGLINVIGSTLKFITGTMDNDDYTDISQHLNNLDNNIQQLTDQTNEQVIINNNLLKNINYVVEHVKELQNKLSITINSITNETSKGLVIIKTYKFILQTYMEINRINKQLEQFSDIILLSKLNVLAHDILTEEEIFKYNITVEVLPYLRNAILFKNNILIFAIGIPNFTKEKYLNAIVIPFPNKNYEQLDIQNEEIIVENNNVYINSKEVISKKKLVRHKNDCIRNIFSKTNTCKLRINNITTIENIFDNVIITRNLPLLELSQNCIDRSITIKNNNIIKFSNCKIIIDNNVFQNKIEKFTNSILIPIVHTNFTKIINNLTLETLHIDNVKNRKTIEYINYKNNVTTYSYTGLILVISIIILISLFFISNNKKKEEHISNIKIINDPFAGTAKTLNGGDVI